MIQVEIDFRPTDGPPQTLYAELTREEFQGLSALTRRSDAVEFVLTIPSRTERDGAVYDWLYRADLVTLREV